MRNTRALETHGRIQFFRTGVRLQGERTDAFPCRTCPCGGGTVSSALREEQYRELRYERPISLVTVSLEGCIGSARNDLCRGMEGFIPGKRSSNIIGWCSPDRLGLILPETDPVAAQKVETRLRNHLKGDKRLSSHRKALENGMISVAESAGLQREYPSRVNGIRPVPEENNGKGPAGSFLRRLQQERNRSDRNNRPFSVVLVPLTCGELETRRLVKNSIDLFSRSSRLSDTWGWYAHDRLALLLPETNEEGARRVTARLITHLQGAGVLRSGSARSLQPIFSIHEYPKVLRKNVFVNLAKNGVRAMLPEKTSEIEGNGKAWLPWNSVFLHRNSSSSSLS